MKLMHFGFERSRLRTAFFRIAPTGCIGIVLLCAATFASTAAVAAIIPTGGTIVLSSSSSVCPPTGICATASSSLPSGVYGSFNNFGTIETLTAGAEANADFLKASIDYGVSGGSANFQVHHADLFTLVGAPGGLIGFTATLHITGNHDAKTSIAAGFTQPGGGSYLGGSSSIFYGLNNASVVDTTVTQAFSVLAGNSFGVYTGISFLATSHGVANYGSTATLSFNDLPAGYYLTSIEGYSGVGSAPAVSVPEPSSIGLFGLGLAALGFAARRRLRSYPARPA